MVIASSAAVYGSNPPLPAHEELLVNPASPYAATKAAIETYARGWQAAYGIRALTLRLFNVFGPLQAADHVHAAAIPAFVSAATEGRPVPIHGDGTQTRDFVDVTYVAAVLVEAAERRIAHVGPVNLASGSRRSLIEIVETLERLGRPLKRRHLPLRTSDAAHSQADVTTLRQLFPGLRSVAFGDCLRATVAWFRATALGNTVIHVR